MPLTKKKVLLALLVGMQIAVAHAQSAASFHSGNDLAQWYVKAARVDRDGGDTADLTATTLLHGYARGAIDIGSGEGLFCPPPTMTSAQALALIKAELDASPQKWHFSASSFVTRAMAKAFPCK